MLHHLMVGTWTPPGAIFTFAFDDQALTLQLVKRTAIPEDQPISWMTLSHDRKTLYGAAMKHWSSYTIHSPTEITHCASQPLSGHPLAASKETNTRAIFLLAAQQPPYAVYCAPFYSHASNNTVLSATLAHLQDYPLAPHAGVHGMAFSPSEAVLYSADMHANCLWVHAKDARTGTLTLLGNVPAPAPNDHPRWVAVHPSGKHLYALMEGGNRLVVYGVDAGTHMPVATGAAFPLVRRPDGVPLDAYRSDVVAVSASGRTLFASARSNRPGAGGLPGFVSAFSLDDNGAVKEQVLLMETTTSGGHSNAVSPCPWSDEWVALTDDEVGFVEMYRWDEAAGTLERVSRCELPGEKGFGMNAVWYD